MTEAAGSIMLAQNYLKSTLADVTAFRTWCGAVDQEEALARIYHDAPPPASGGEYTLAELAVLRPYAIVSTSPENGITGRKIATGTFTDNGTLFIYLEQAIPDEVVDDPAESEILFKNSLGLIKDGLETLAETAGYLCFDEITLAEGPVRSRTEESATQDDHQWAVFQVSYGSE